LLNFLDAPISPDLLTPRSSALVKLADPSMLIWYKQDLFTQNEDLKGLFQAFSELEKLKSLKLELTFVDFIAESVQFLAFLVSRLTSLENLEIMAFSRQHTSYFTDLNYLLAQLSKLDKLKSLLLNVPIPYFSKLPAVATFPNLEQLRLETEGEDTMIDCEGFTKFLAQITSKKLSALEFYFFEKFTDATFEARMNVISSNFPNLVNLGFNMKNRVDNIQNVLLKTLKNLKSLSKLTLDLEKSKIKELSMVKNYLLKFGRYDNFYLSCMDANLYLTEVLKDKPIKE